MTSHALLILLSFTITDGDTIRAGDVRVRLWGIDAPEMSEAGGQAAKQHLRRITAGQELRCEVVDVDRYGRLVGRCELPGGRDVACEMVADGHARDWPKYSGGYYAGCDR